MANKKYTKASVNGRGPGEKVSKTDPGYNRQMMKFNMEIFSMPKIDLRDPEQVTHRMIEFFELCAKYDKKPLYISLANALGIDRHRLMEIKTGEYRHDEAFSFVSEASASRIQKVTDMMNGVYEDYMMNGKVNPATGIFLMKNYFGYKDQNDYNFTTDNSAEKKIDAAAIRKKYKVVNPVPPKEIEGQKDQKGDPSNDQKS